jgi:hypothetical protein
MIYPPWDTYLPFLYTCMYMYGIVYLYIPIRTWGSTNLLPCSVSESALFLIFFPGVDVKLLQRFDFGGGGGIDTEVSILCELWKSFPGK